MMASVCSLTDSCEDYKTEVHDNRTHDCHHLQNTERSIGLNKLTLYTDLHKQADECTHYSQ